MPSSPQPGKNQSSRRDFLKSSSALAVGGTLAGSLGIAQSAHAAGGDVLRVGLIGSGGRGRGAAKDALSADPNVKLVAIGDAFADRAQDGLNDLLKIKQFADRIDVPRERLFSGFDAYKKVIESGVDVVLLTTPPHFRPEHLKAAIAADKHVFCEKPVAVDAPGVRSVLETCKAAKQKNLAVVSGLCWRYHAGMQATFDKIADGALGDIVTLQCNYLTSQLWHRGRNPKWSDMEYQIRNWLYFTWLSGDHNVEQHIHSLDKMAWVMGDEPPKYCYGSGGRSQRTEDKFGHIFDHHAVVYEYANGVKCFAQTRQMDGCFREVKDYVMGTKGTCSVMDHYIKGETNWRFKRRPINMYRAEHEAMFASIRDGKPINNGEYMSKSTLMAIMGRMATYTGQKITWEQAMNSQENLSPSRYEWGNVDVPQPIAIPGKTSLV